MQPDAHGPDMPLVLRVSSKPSPSGSAVPWPDITDEEDLVRSLIGVSPSWSIWEASSSVTTSTLRRQVIDLVELKLAVLVEMEELENEQRAALRLLQSVTEAKEGKPQAKRTTTRAKRTKRRAFDKDSGCSTSVDSNFEDLRSADREARRKEGAEKTSEKKKGKADADVDAAAAPKKKLKVSTRVAEDNILEVIGRVKICKVFRAGKLHALSLQCNRHKDLGEVDSVQCARDLTLAKGLSQEEAVRRLKRWYVAGLVDHEWPADAQRSTHKKLGGQLLKAFADGSEWGGEDMDELDQLIKDNSGL